MNQTQLAERIGIGRGAVGAWENGKNTPPLSVFDKLCRELEIDPTSMMRYDLKNLNKSSEVREGDFKYERPTNVIVIDIDGSMDSELWPMLPMQSPNHNKWFVKKIRGQRMEPTASNGDYIVCEQVDTIVDDALYLLKYKTGNYSFNQVRRDYEYKEAKKLELINHNDLYKSHTVPQDEIEVFYKVYKIMKLYDT